jgi:hypothetical protein
VLRLSTGEANADDTAGGEDGGSVPSRRTLNAGDGVRVLRLQTATGEDSTGGDNGGRDGSLSLLRVCTGDDCTDGEDGGSGETTSSSSSDIGTAFTRGFGVEGASADISTSTYTPGNIRHRHQGKQQR